MKKIAAVLMIGMMLFSLTGCTGGTNSSNNDASWSISVEGAGEKTIDFTEREAEKIGMTTMKVAMKNKDSSLPEQEWEGISLEKLLENYGAKNYTTIKVESADGSFKE